MAIRVLLTDELLDHLAALYQSFKGRLAFMDQGLLSYWAEGDPPTESYSQAYRKNDKDGWPELHLISYSYLTDLEAANKALRVEEPWQEGVLWQRPTFQEFLEWYCQIWQQPDLRLPYDLAV